MRFAIAVLLLAPALLGQALNLSGPATARPGQTIAVDVLLASPSVDLAAMQWSIAPPPNYTIAKAAAGAASTAAGKSLYCNAPATNCLVVGVNTNVYGAGVVATYQVTVPAAATPGPVSISMPGAAPLIGVIGSTLTGGTAPLSVGAPYSFLVLAPTDLNGDGKTDIQDLLILIQEILGGGPVAGNQNGDGSSDVRDAQIVARAVPGP
jgi:hypothetical protein